MQAKRTKALPDVHILTQRADMKFIPEIYDAPAQNISSTQRSSIGSKLRSFLGFSGSNQGSMISNPSQISISDSQKQISAQDDSKISQSSLGSKYIPPSLEFVNRITPEFILIGNCHQLDLINIGNISENHFVDTQFFWSLKFRGKISAVAVDSKKMNVLAVIVDKSLKIYKYDYKKIPRQPFPVFKEIQLDSAPLCMTMAKDGNICVFHKNRYEIYAVTDQVRKRKDKKYEVYEIGKQQNFQVLTVPQPYQNILNIFFAETLPNSKVFVLWAVQLEFQALQIKHSQPRKIYEIKNEYKNTLTLSNYARDIFIMNLKNEINAVKPGYVLDSANIKKSKGQQFLNYMGNDILFHTSKVMIQVYNFSLNTQSKPSRIQIKAKDSIKINSDLTDYQFFKILPIFNNEYIIIFQIQNKKNKNRNGQVRYCLFLTKGITRQEKINILFPKYSWNFQPGSDDLNQRCDMARKMGLSVKQIYLQLWNRTDKCQQRDFQILISTNDYATIKNQILRKLRKASMPFKQIWKIEQQCYFMLENRIFSSDCTQQAIMEFISCHFFLRKLQMFKQQELLERQQKQLNEPIIDDTEENQNKDNQKDQNNTEEKNNQNNQNAEKDKKTQNSKMDEDKIIKMTIRRYQNLRGMQIKSELLNQITLFCDQGKMSAIRNIRFLLRSFKFVFRTIYYDLLEEIIEKAQDKLYDLIKQIPQLLPYTPQQINTELTYPVNFFDGVWPDINTRQWKQSLYVDGITTIDNKQIMLQKVIKSLSFRRNYLSQHDMVTISKKQIISNANKLKSSQTFYFFIAKMFKILKNAQIQKKVVNFLQENYQIMPSAIKRKVFLIERLYRFLSQSKLLPQVDGQPCSLTQFLKFKDEEFIRHCFIEQRSIKGLILKKIKPLYEEVCGQQGKSLFNTALLNYFISDLSQVSDLKYILNRINNQKKQFHFQNQEMYQILVEALQRKLMIGTDNDIPIQQVLIYIQNIPFREDEFENGQKMSAAMLQLQLVNSVKEQVQLLQAAKINMSVYDILHKQDQVITKLVNYLIKQGNIFNQKNYIFSQQSKKQILKVSYSIIATLESLSQEIYGKSNSKRIFFIYLTKLCEKAEMIKYACHLLEDQNLIECYDASMGENLVQYLYKFKMSEQKTMIYNEYYVSELLNLIPPECITRVYLQCQMKYAKILSRPEQPYEYPINQSAYTINDLKNQLVGLPIDFLLQINLQELYKVIHKIQQIYLDSISQSQQDQFQFSIGNFITLHQMYQIVIIELLHARKLKQVLPYIRKILQQQISDPTYNIIYPILYIIEISGQINDENKTALISSISYYFYHPWSLLQILQDLVNQPRNTRQIKQFLDLSLHLGKSKSKGYNIQNPVFNQDYLQSIQSKQEQLLFMQQINQATKHMQDSKEQFKDVKYAAIMSMLCNSPYALAKLITCSQRVNVSAIRCFLSYAIRQDIFNSLAILELGKRIFLILLEAQKNKEALQQVIQRFCDYNLLDEQIEAEFVLQQQNQQIQLLKLWWRSAQAFRKKKQKVQKDLQNQLKVDKQESKEAKSDRIKKSLGSRSNQDEQNQYPFSKFDNDNEIQDIIDIRESVGYKKTRNLLKFNAGVEIDRVLDKNSRQNLFSSSKQQLHRHSGQLSMSIRGQKYRSDPKNQYVSHNSGTQMKKGQSFQEHKQMDLAQSHQIFESMNVQSKSRVNEDYHESSGLKKITDNQLQIQSQQMFSSEGQISNPYVVQIKEVQDEQSQIQDGMIESVQIEISRQKITGVDLACNMLEENLEALKKSSKQFNLNSLSLYEKDRDIIRDVVKQIYKARPSEVRSQNILNMILEISRKFPSAQISSSSIEMLINCAQQQEKKIADIPFTQVLPSSKLLNEFIQKKDIFQAISTDLSRFTDSQNLHKVCLFVRKAFTNPEFQGYITWNYIMNLCAKFDSYESEQVQMNLQKIESLLCKVKLHIWNLKFDIFEEKVLKSRKKQILLKIFCEYLTNAVPRSQAAIFIQKLASKENLQIVTKTLAQIQ